MVKRLWWRLRETVRLYFVAGLLTFAPVGITLWAITWIIQRLDNLLLPPLIGLVSADPAPPDLPPLVGALFTFAVILFAGVIVRHFFGHQLVRLWERLLARIPIARTIYGSVKQLFEAIALSGGSSFNRVVIIEYPRAGVYSLAFTTGRARGPVARALADERLVNCFVPTTPNPTSGYYLLVPEKQIRDVDLSIEDAFKLVMSAGLVTPGADTPPAPEVIGVPEPERA